MHGLAAGLLCALLILSSTVRAQEEPLWEAGVGMAMMTLPDYRGADEGKTYAFPVPYISYNGQNFRIDRRGAHGDIAQRGNVWLDVSVNLGPPADSEENDARRGMPDLDPIIEIGPSLRMLWLANERQDRTLTLYLPLRAVIATDFSHADTIGWIFAPHLTYDHLKFGPGGGWNFSASLGPLYASEDFHDYYYEVRPEFATATRPTYNAEGGYSGARTTFTLSKRFKDYWVGSFVRYDSLRGAAFEDSPLVRTNHSFMAGIAVSWIFARSAERVPVRTPAAD
jgi:outer membrane scaffolding protein for murein synthesis (MipA/OmpV family)